MMHPDYLTRVHDPLLTDVNTRYVAGMNVDPLRGVVHFRLTLGDAAGQERLLTLNSTAYVSTSCNPDDIEDLDALAFIADLTIYSFADGGCAVLEKLNYQILNLNGGVRTYPGTLRYYIHMEGDICADIVCGSYVVSHVRSQ